MQQPVEYFHRLLLHFPIKVNQDVATEYKVVMFFIEQEVGGKHIPVAEIDALAHQFR
ncbi:hypothetical protein D3C81_1938040 [compost metagenome]